MRGVRFTLSCLAACAALQLAAVRPAQAQTSPAAYKAAIVFNIIRFAEFAATRSSATINLCAPATEAISSELQGLAGRRIAERTLSVRLITGSGNYDGCDVIYAGTNASLRRSLPKGALTIGEEPNFTNAGGGVGLTRLGRQIRFEVNIESARDAGVHFSSKLLRLATAVHGMN